MATRTLVPVGTVAIAIAITVAVVVVAIAVIAITVAIAVSLNQAPTVGVTALVAVNTSPESAISKTSDPIETRGVLLAYTVRDAVRRGSRCRPGNGVSRRNRSKERKPSDRTKILVAQG
jgi:hypothetical protein